MTRTFERRCLLAFAALALVVGVGAPVARAEDELTIVRPAASQGCSLVVVLNDSPKTYTFRDERSMVRFQADMETLLTHTGWSFVGFQPERRGRRDRRTMPRMNERRRWWTDGWLFSAK